jgi:hypothetical protein
LDENTQKDVDGVLLLLKKSKKNKKYQKFVEKLLKNGC